MSHFSVLVIGDNVEEQLAPYQENNMDDFPEEYLEFNDETEEVENDYKDRDKKYKDMNIEEFAKEYNGYEKNDDGKFGYMYNPNSYWDWYVIGGRWAGELKLKEGKEGELEDPNCLGICSELDEKRKKIHNENVKNRCVDSARKGDIDFSVGKEEYNKEIRFWEMKIEGKEPITEEEKERMKWDWYKKEYYIEKYGDKETYAKLQTTFSTYAVVKDGKWYAKGDMGWFGCSSATPNEEREWEEKFVEHLNKLPDNTILTIIDCHI